MILDTVGEFSLSLAKLFSPESRSSEQFQMVRSNDLSPSARYLISLIWPKTYWSRVAFSMGFKR